MGSVATCTFGGGTEVGTGALVGAAYGGPVGALVGAGIGGVAASFTACADFESYLVRGLQHDILRPGAHVVMEGVRGAGDMIEDGYDFVSDLF
jgi:hypothetical protein